MQDIHSISERTEELKYERVFNECLYFIELHDVEKLLAAENALFKGDLCICSVGRS